MVTSKKYRQQIDELRIEAMNVDVSSPGEAIDKLIELEEIEKIMEKIRFNVRTDVRSIRMEYIRKIGNIQDSYKKLGLFERQKSSGDLFKEKKSLMDDRDLKISSYQYIEKMIDDYLAQIKDSKDFLVSFILKYSDK
jgi:hypothetical protein